MVSKRQSEQLGHQVLQVSAIFTNFHIEAFLFSNFAKAFFITYVRSDAITLSVDSSNNAQAKTR